MSTACADLSKSGYLFLKKASDLLCLIRVGNGRKSF